MAQRRAPPTSINLPTQPSSHSSSGSAYLTPTLPSPRINTLGTSPLGRHGDGTLRSPSYFGSLSSRYDARSLQEQSMGGPGGGRTRRGRGVSATRGHGSGAESNWDTLHEMVGDDDEEVNGGLGLGIGINDSRQGDGRQEDGIVRRLTSHSTLRSFFSARSAHGAESPRTAVPRARAVPAGGPTPDPSFSAVLSTSPPSMAPLEDMYSGLTGDARRYRSTDHSQRGSPRDGRSRSLSPVPPMLKRGSTATLRPQGSGDRTPLLSALEDRPVTKQPLKPPCAFPSLLPHTVY